MNKKLKTTGFFLILFILFNCYTSFLLIETKPSSDFNSSESIESIDDRLIPISSYISQRNYSTSQSVNSVAISSNGTYIAVGDGAAGFGKAYLFNSSSSTPMWSFQFGEEVEAVTISADGFYIAATSGWGTTRGVSVFNKLYSPSKTPLWSYDPSAGMYLAKLSSDGSRLAATTANVLYLFNTTNAAAPLLWSYNVGTFIRGLDLSSNGSIIAIGADGGNFMLFNDTVSGPKTPMWTVNTLDQGRKDVSVTPDGNYILAGSDKLYMFNKSVTSPKLSIWTYDVGDDIYSLTMTPDRDFIAFVDSDDYLYFYNKTNGILWSIDDFEPRTVVMSSNGKYLALNDHDEIQIFNGKSKRPITHKMPDSVSAMGNHQTIDMSDDGKYVVCGNRGGLAHLVKGFPPDYFTLSSDAENPDDGQFNLNWDKSTGVDNYTIYHSATDFETSSNIDIISEGIDKDTTSRTVSADTGNHYYIVYAYNGTGYYYSNQVFVDVEAKGDNGAPPPINIMIIVLLVGIVSAGLGGTAVVVIKRKPPKQPLIALKKKRPPGEAKTEISAAETEKPAKDEIGFKGEKGEIQPSESHISELKKRKAVKVPPAAVKPKKPKKAVKGKAPIKFDMAEPAAAALTAAEIAEVRKTEKEVDVEKQKFICVVHKGPIEGDNYLCPNCQTFYCVKCAKALKEKGEKCWSCAGEIKVAESKAEIQERVQELKTKLDSLKNTVKNIDDNFFAGAIDKEEYSKMKDSLTGKIGNLLAEIKRLKEG